MAINTQLLDGIVLFTEVVSSGSFTRAAESTGHSTSHISKVINKLESRLGIRLLHRTTRTLSLTHEGQIYFSYCQQLIEDMTQAETLISGGQVSPKGRLKISLPLSFSLSRMTPIFNRFLQQYPEVDLELDLNDRHVDMIADGYDLIIRATSQLDDSSLVSRKILSSYAITLASPAYLKTHGTPKHPKELENHKVISYSNLKQQNIWSFKDEFGNTVSVKTKSRVLTNSPETELALCIQGIGITRLPKFYLTDELASGRLVELFTNCQRHPIDIFIIYPSKKHLSLTVRTFIDFTLQALNESALT